jgi:hypothetical protein
MRQRLKHRIYNPYFIPRGLASLSKPFSGGACCEALILREAAPPAVLARTAARCEL